MARLLERTPQESGAELAREKLEQLIREAITPGFFGRVILEISVQNGIIGQVEETTKKTHRVN